MAVEKFLNAVPCFLGDQWLIGAWVGLAIEIEIAAVKTLAENLVQGAFVDAHAAERQPFNACLRRQFFE